MTCIVYSKKHGQIGFESRLTSGTNIVTDNDNKSIVRDKVLFVFAGAASDVEDLMAMYFDPTIINAALEADAIIVDEGNVFITENSKSGLKLAKLDFNEAIGSGSPWALAALDFGATVKDAVKYAIRKDCGCGGRVRVINVKDFK
jgi:ATP-dependent protease HslVU (ClpYQ) peptidase subunit